MNANANGDLKIEMNKTSDNNKVEPRTWLSNERTFLKWMRMGGLGFIVAMALLSFAKEPISGILLIILSIIVIFRSYFIYISRNKLLLYKDPILKLTFQWNDTFGPKLLLFALLLPILTGVVYLYVFHLNEISGLPWINNS